MVNRHSIAWLTSVGRLRNSLIYFAFPSLANMAHDLLD